MCACVLFAGACLCAADTRVCVCLVNYALTTCLVKASFYKISVVLLFLLQSTHHKQVMRMRLSPIRLPFICTEFLHLAFGTMLSVKSMLAVRARICAQTQLESAVFWKFAYAAVREISCFTLKSSEVRCSGVSNMQHTGNDRL